MKIVSKNFTPYGSLSIKMVPEEEEDLWVLHNLIEEGDTVLSHTTRKVIQESASGKKDTKKVGLKLQIKVKALNKFFTNVIDAFLKHIDFKVVHCVVIGSPGFTKDQFHRQLLLEAETKQIKQIMENKSWIILVHTSSGYKNSDIPTRHKYEKLVGSVKGLGGMVHVFSSGEQLAMLTGIAAILRFPLADLDDIEM